MEQQSQKPAYFVALRALQALLGLIVLVMAAYFIHGASTSEIVWALICGLFTIAIAAINISASRIAGLQKKSITLVLIAIDAAFVVFWLASMAANARLISLLKVPVTCQATYSNGEAINSKYCLTKRTNYSLVVGSVGKGIIGAIIAFSILELLLFIAVMLLTLLHLKRGQSFTAAPTLPSQSKATEALPAQNASPLPAQHQQVYQQGNVWQQQQQQQHQPTSYQSQMSTHPQQYYHQQEPQQLQAPPEPYQQQQQQYHQSYQSSLLPQHHDHFPQRTVSPVYSTGAAQQQTYFAAPAK